MLRLSLDPFFWGRNGDTAAAEIGQSAVFDWFKAWYPLAIAQELDPGIPHPVQLLGKSLVLWRPGGEKTWRVFEDRCPHRLAPLSEGRIDATDGSLFCNYHGWRFDGEGKCLNIPQLAGQQTRISDSPRACAVSYPTYEDEGLVWVWPSSGAEAHREAESWRQSNGGPGITPLTGPDEHLVGGWYMRDVPVRWETVRENAFNDPSHDNVLHHGYFIANRSNAQNFLQLAETWKGHLVFHDILDADIAIQAGVDRNRAQKKRVFTPSAADRQPAAFHQWLRKHGGGAVPFEQNPDAAVGVPGGQMQRELLLDRFLSHTVHCSACRKAYNAMQLLQKVALREA
ncbi:hypothetical protein WJX75_008839 [Coccomyxa subellipsoidea]|uniref:Rieske domain-containing protein n=1 Tax=Coccomyxa subellipsoidea TaxID=248742 RepID=A0ABR2YBQ7_9CHLO